MFRKYKYVFLILLITALLIIPDNELSGQKKGAVCFGIGFPELLNAGVKYNISGQTAIGTSLGWWPPSTPGIISWTNLFSISGDLFYHFGGKSEYTEIRPWYFRMSINCIMEENGWWFSFLRIGREFNLDDYCAFSLDAGVFYNLNNKSTGIIPVFVSAGAGISYRF
jgi:hypothetical protein